MTKLAEEYDSEFVEAVAVMIDKYITDMPKLSVIDIKAPKKEKKTRAPTAYNLFLKAKMAEIKESGADFKGKELMQAAIVEWNKLKAQNELIALMQEPDAEPKTDDADSDADAEEMPKASKSKKGKGNK